VQRHRADIGAERQPQDRRAREIALGPPTAARHLHQEASRAADSHADKHAKRQLGDGSARASAGTVPGGCRSRHGDQHDRRGDPVVEPGLDVDQPPDARGNRRVDHDACAEGSVRRRERRTHQQGEPDVHALE
jgi:hypothetical protein